MAGYFEEIEIMATKKCKECNGRGSWLDREYNCQEDCLYCRGKGTISTELSIEELVDMIEMCKQSRGME